MLEKLWHVPTTKESHPYLQADFRCDFANNGYVEDEYFYSGKANVYQENANGGAETIFENAPYCTRFLVRRPEDPQKFSGNVVLEVLNATANMDIDRIWVNSWKYFVRNGDLYIGVTSKSSVLGALWDADKERYKPMCFDNPLPNRKEPEEENRFGFDPKYEWGLFWDMLVDLAAALRKPDGILCDYGVFRLFLAGWSQSTGYVTRMVNTFPERAYALFDGFMAAGGWGGMQALNAYQTQSLPDMFGKGKVRVMAMGAQKPFMAINTQSEFEWVNYVGDNDKPTSKFRIYELGGASHDSRYNLLEYYQDDKDTARICRTPEYGGETETANDYPAEPIFNAAWRNLFYWAAYGIPAPHAKRLCRDEDGRMLTDAFGHALGGVRSAALNYPTAKYFSHTECRDGRVNPLFGHIEPLSKGTINELYGNLDNYRALVTADCTRCVAEGFLLSEDVEELIERLVTLAKERGLKAE